MHLALMSAQLGNTDSHGIYPYSTFFLSPPDLSDKAPIGQLIEFQP